MYNVYAVCNKGAIGMADICIINDDAVGILNVFLIVNGFTFRDGNWSNVLKRGKNVLQFYYFSVIDIAMNQWFRNRVERLVKNGIQLINYLEQFKFSDKK